MQIQKNRCLRRGRSGRGGRWRLFSMSAICVRVSFRQKLSCARHARLRKFWRKSLKLLKLLTWGSSKPLKLLKFIARLKSSKVFKVKLLPETLLPDHASFMLRCPSSHSICCKRLKDLSRSVLSVVLLDDSNGSGFSLAVYCICKVVI